MIACALGLALGCGGDGGARQEPAREAPGTDLPDPAWVRIYDPQEAWNGYTLTLHRRRLPVLLDMNGETVHAWPEARVKSRVRLLPDGSILGLGLGRWVVEYDWEGERTWEHRTPGAFPHHDLRRLDNGNTLIVLKVEGEAGDTLVEVTRGGQEVWRWKALDHLGPYLPSPVPRAGDVTHINSVQELPENPWFEAGDERFRPGNLLLSARNLDAVFVVERASGRVLWWFGEDLDHQHEPLMNPPDLPFPGFVQVFNNRRGSFFSDRRSEVLEIDPRDGGVRWRFRAPGFFTGTGGTQQALPNGNVLITSTRGRRVFEVTRRGRIVWQWAPPYQAVRALRVGPDACPQLPGLRARRTRAVKPPPGYLHVDPEAYRFSRRGSRREVRVEGERRTVLKKALDCRRLLLPAQATLELGFGVDREVWRRARPAGDGVIFRARIRGGPEQPPVELLGEEIGEDGPAWRRRSLSLAPYGLGEVELCVGIEGGGEDNAAPGERFAFWEPPVLSGPEDPGSGGEEAEDPAEGLDAEEREVQRQHLKSLGYVD